MLDYTESHGWFLYTLIRNCARTTYTKYCKEYQIHILIKMFDSLVYHFKYFLFGKHFLRGHCCSSPRETRDGAVEYHSGCLWCTLGQKTYCWLEEIRLTSWYVVCSAVFIQGFIHHRWCRISSINRSNSGKTFGEGWHGFFMSVNDYLRVKVAGSLLTIMGFARNPFLWGILCRGLATQKVT